MSPRILQAAVLFGVVAAAISGSVADAGVLYDDGPVNGTYNSWTISSGFQVQDSFTLASPSTLTGVTFGNWLFQNSTGNSVEWSIVNTEGTQTPLSCATCSGTAALTAGASFTNGFTYYVVDQSFSLPNLTLGAGTYWLELQNEVTSNGQQGLWDMNGGPSGVWESVFGDQSGPNCTANSSINGDAAGTCSDSFQILGTTGTSVPEPATLALFGSALLGFAFFRRRKRT